MSSPTRLEFFTDDYQAAHGAKPRGAGNWGFYFGRDGGCEREATFVPFLCTYSEACAWAKSHARTIGATFAIVGS